MKGQKVQRRLPCWKKGSTALAQKGKAPAYAVNVNDQERKETGSPEKAQPVIKRQTG